MRAALVPFVALAPLLLGSACTSTAAEGGEPLPPLTNGRAPTRRPRDGRRPPRSPSEQAPERGGRFPSGSPSPPAPPVDPHEAARVACGVHVDPAAPPGASVWLALSFY